MIWDQANQGRQALTPDNNLVRFVARNYFGKPAHFLDIGPGANAPNYFWLKQNHFKVTSVDISHEVPANYHVDIRDVDLFAPESFDCVLDINTLCHVENPPFGKIASWLKPGGVLFSIAPSLATATDHLEGKGFCRLLRYDDIGPLYRDFHSVGVRPFQYGEIHSWIIQATKITAACFI